MKRNWPLGPLGLVLLLPTISACSTVSPTVNKRTLPPETSVVLSPLPLPQVKAGMDARVSLAEHRSALRAANSRLSKSRAIYRGVRKTYGAD